MSDRTVRLRIEAISELPLLQDQMAELIKLTKQHQEATQQSALSARTGSIQQVEAIQGITSALKEQQTQQKKNDDEASAGRKKVASELDELGKQARSFQTLIATAFTVDKIMSFSQDVIEAKTQIDNLKISLDVMLGSKAESAKLYSQIVETAKATPFTLAEVAENVVKLKAYNIATADLIPTVNALGNIAAAVGKDKLPQLTLAYGQVINTGKLMLTETKQFIDAGVPLYDLLADAMKKPKAEVIALAADHKIMAADVKKAIMDTSEVGGRYYGLMALQSKTVGGEVDKMKDSYQQAKVMVGDFFENTIQSGTRQLNSLMESTIGSNTAIQRTWDIVRSVAVAVATYTVATKAQAAADLIVTAYQATKNLLYGEYLLAMRAVTAQQIVFTAAETEAVVAAEAFNLAIASNPVGALITLLGALTAGYFAYKAVTDEVTSSLGEEELKLKSQRQELSDLIITASLAADGTKQRKDAIQLLIDKYPEYFKGINSETTTNEQLRGILDKVNASYQIRIDLARQAYKVEQAKSAQTELFKLEDELFARVVKTNVLNEEVIATFGGSAAKLLEYMNANKKAAYDLNTTWTGFYRQSIGQLATDIAKQQSDVSSALGDATKSIQKAKAEQIEADKASENLRWSNSMASLKKGSAEYTAAHQQHLDNLAKIDGTYHEKEVKAIVDTAEKKKQVQLVSDKEWAVIKKGNDAENELDRMKELKSQLDFLDKQEEAEAAIVRKAQVNKKISNAALAALQEDARMKLMAIDAKYDKLRAEVMVQVEEETQRAFLVKVQQSNDKIAVLTAKRLEAEKMLTLLNDAKTSDERLAALKVFHEKYNNSVQEATVEQLKIQRDASKKELDDIIDKNGEKGDAYRRAYANYLRDNEQYNTALTNQTTVAARTTASTIEKYEKDIQQARKATAKLEKDTLEQTNQNRQEFLAGMANLLSKDGGFMGNIASGLVSLYKGIDGMQLKALEGAKNTLKTAQDTLANVKSMYDGSTAQGAAAIAEATEGVAAAKDVVAQASGETVDGVISMMIAAYQVLSLIADAINAEIAKTNKAIAQAMANVYDAYVEYSRNIRDIQRDTYKTEMQYFNGSLKERLAAIDDYYAREAEYAKGTSRVQATLEYYKKITQLTVDAGTDIKKVIEGLIRIKAEADQQSLRDTIEAAEREKEHIKEVLDAKLDAIQTASDTVRQGLEDQMDAARDAADVEKDLATDKRDKAIDAINATLDAAKEAYNQQMDAAREAYQKETDAVKEAYDTQLAALKDKEAQERADIQATYDLKQKLLEQATADQIEEISILDRVRNEALERYRAGEITRITATRDRILATLTDERERATVTAAYEQQLKDLHTEVEEAKLDKSKGVSLATKQINKEQKEDTERLKQEETTTLTNLANTFQTLFTNLANERDTKLQDLKVAQEKRENDLKEALKTLEQTSANDKKTINETYATAIKTINDNLSTVIKGLQNAILGNEQSTALSKKVAQEEYANATKQLNIQIYESNKQLMIAQLQAEVAVLEAKKNLTNDGRITAAQNAIVAVINQLIGSSSGISPVGGLPEQTTGPNAGTPIYSAFTADGKKVTITYSNGHNITVYDANKNEIKVKNGIGYIEETGQYFFKGTNYAELGINPRGRDTIPARINEGERIITTADNLAIGGRSLSNEELIGKVRGYDLLKTTFPQMFMPNNAPVMRLPDSVMSGQTGGSIDISGLRKDMAQMNKTLGQLKQVNVNVDQRGLHMAEETHQSKMNYYSKLMQG